MAERRLISSGSPYERTIGFSRAVRVGSHVHVSGTAPIAPNGTPACPGDAYLQAKRCLEIIENALKEAGAFLRDVVRTRPYITDKAHLEGVGRAHGEAFGEVRPASTMVVAQLLDPAWLVEMEVDAVLP